MLQYIGRRVWSSFLNVVGLDIVVPNEKVSVLYLGPPDSDYRGKNVLNYFQVLFINNQKSSANLEGTRWYCI